MDTWHQGIRALGTFNIGVMMMMDDDRPTRVMLSDGNFIIRIIVDHKASHGNHKRLLASVENERLQCPSIPKRETHLLIFGKNKLFAKVPNRMVYANIDSQLTWTLCGCHR